MFMFKMVTECNKIINSQLYALMKAMWWMLYLIKWPVETTSMTNLIFIGGHKLYLGNTEEASGSKMNEYCCENSPSALHFLPSMAAQLFTVVPPVACESSGGRNAADGVEFFVIISAHKPPLKECSSVCVRVCVSLT